MRLAAIALLAALAAAPVAAPAPTLATTTVPNPVPAADRTVILRPSITVSDAVVRIGDLFLNAGALADRPIVHAPEPGRRLAIDARWLYRVVRGLGLDWRPSSLTEQIVVERDSVVLGREDLQQRLLDALAARGIDTARLQIELGNGVRQIHLPNAPGASLTIEDIAYDARQGQFTAVLAIAGAGTPAQRLKVSGRLAEMMEVPVLTRRIAAGDVIGPGDIGAATVRSQSLNKDAVLAADRLIGHTSRRGLAAGVPVRAADLQRPQAVSKGELVTMMLNSGPMALTARGRALAGGAKGEVIRVANTNSRGIVDAMVVAPGQVTVALAR